MANGVYTLNLPFFTRSRNSNDSFFLSQRAVVTISKSIIIFFFVILRFIFNILLSGSACRSRKAHSNFTILRCSDNVFKYFIFSNSIMRVEISKYIVADSDIVELIAAGESIEKITKSYRGLTKEMVKEALEYAAKAISGEHYVSYTKVPSR